MSKSEEFSEVRMAVQTLFTYKCLKPLKTLLHLLGSGLGAGGPVSAQRQRPPLRQTARPRVAATPHARIFGFGAAVSRTRGMVMLRWLRLPNIHMRVPKKSNTLQGHPRSEAIHTRSGRTPHTYAANARRTHQGPGTPCRPAQAQHRSHATNCSPTCSVRPLAAEI